MLKHVRHRHRRVGRVTAALLLVVTGLVAWGSPAGAVEPDTYVALGDSYASGPLIPDTPFENIGCLRSTRNYPQRLRGQISTHAPVFKDRTCNGATTHNLQNPQSVWFGLPNPAQTNALDDRTKVVTLTMGGNDIGFAQIVASCISVHISAPGCEPGYTAGGVDQISNRIELLRPNIGTALSHIKGKAPNAEVFVVGYPTIVPQTGVGCYPWEPFGAGDVPYLREKTEELNAMIEAEAADAGVHFVDLYAMSAGRDICASGRWVEGMVPQTDALAMHPNKTGMKAFADHIAVQVNNVLAA